MSSYKIMIARAEGYYHGFDLPVCGQRPTANQVLWKGAL